jgi:hypothetical protein
MPAPAVGGAIASIGGGLLQGRAESRATNRAAAAQAEGLQTAITENQRTYGVASDLLKPYVGAGTTALARQMALLGIGGTPDRVVGATPLSIKVVRLGANGQPITTRARPGGGIDPLRWLSTREMENMSRSSAQSLAEQRAARAGVVSGTTGFQVGDRTFATREEAQTYANANATGGQTIKGMSADEAQRQAIESIKKGSQFKELADQGEYGILSNAAATGGLRGGNTQGALAQFRPALLQQLIDKNIADLGGLVGIGGNAAGSLGTAAMGQGQAVGTMLADSGAARAAGVLGSGQAQSRSIAGITGTVGDVFGRLQKVDAGKGVFGSSWGF